MIAAGLALSVATVVFIQKKDTLFQEGNPIPLAGAMTDMLLKDERVAEVKGTDEARRHLVKRGDTDAYIEMMEAGGWRYAGRDEIANRMEFEKGDETKSVTYQYYTRWYTIIYS